MSNVDEAEVKEQIDRRAQQKAQQGQYAYQRHQLGEDIVNDIQMLNAMTEHKSKYSSKDITTAYYTPDTIEIQTEAIPLIMELDSLRLWDCMKMVLDAMGAHACTTKGKGNSAILLTKLAAYRFTMGDVEDSSGLGDKAAKVAEYIGKKMG